MVVSNETVEDGRIDQNRALSLPTLLQKHPSKGLQNVLEARVTVR